MLGSVSRIDSGERVAPADQVAGGGPDVLCCISAIIALCALEGFSMYACTYGGALVGMVEGEIQDVFFLVSIVASVVQQSPDRMEW